MLIRGQKEHFCNFPTENNRAPNLEKKKKGKKEETKYCFFFSIGS